MIDLTPIAKKIQQRLFEKENLLGRVGVFKSQSQDGLTLEKLSSRSTWIRMTSGKEVPVVINGGELLASGRIPAGYDEIYGTRTLNTVKNRIGNLLGGIPKPFSQDVFENENKRPPAGIKSVNCSFKGGIKAIREATINWTCWSFDEIERLTPHFLSPGGTVLVEWGWVYDAKTINNLPTFIDSKGRIKGSASTDYKNRIIKSKGDFDMIMGIIKNFNFSTREDGGFNCTTQLTSLGVSTISNPEVNTKKTTLNTSLTDKAIARVRDAIEVENIVITPKTFIKNINDYCADKLIASETDEDGNTKILGLTEEAKKTQVKVTSAGVNKMYNYIPGQFVIEYKSIPDNPTLIGDVTNVWIRWGWFEDNILSKFYTLTQFNKIVSEFRSIEIKTNADGEEVDEGESVRIRNHPLLRTTDINRYILPGQFKPLKRNKEFRIEIAGDRTDIVALADIVNENFEHFAPRTSVLKTVEYTILSGDTLGKIANKFGTKATAIGKENNLANLNDIAAGDKLKITTGGGDVDYSSGYLRNMLINTKLVHDAWGLLASGTEITSLTDALENLFPLLNRDIDYWGFEIKNDETKTYRSKIVDRFFGIPLPKPEVRIDTSSGGGYSTKSTFSEGLGKVTNNGVHFFPAWAAKSIVKRQSINASIPNAMAVSIMYGKNANKLKTMGATSATVGDEEAYAVGALGEDKNNPDTQLDNVDTPINVTDSHFGTLTDDENFIGPSQPTLSVKPKNLSSGDDLHAYANKNPLKFTTVEENTTPQTISTQVDTATYVAMHTDEFGNIQHPDEQVINPFRDGGIGISSTNVDIGGIPIGDGDMMDDFKMPNDMTQVDNAKLMKEANDINEEIISGNQLEGIEEIDVSGLLGGNEEGFSYNEDEMPSPLEIRSGDVPWIPNPVPVPGLPSGNPIRSKLNMIANYVRNKATEIKNPFKRKNTNQPPVESSFGEKEKKPITPPQVEPSSPAIDQSYAVPLPEYMQMFQNDTFDKIMNSTSDFISKDPAMEQKTNPLAVKYSSVYDENGRMKDYFIEGVGYNVDNYRKKSTMGYADKPVMLPLTLDLDIDGIGGIYPGNSYHSTYLPKRYKEDALFQVFNVTHQISSAGWTTSLSGKMRSNLARLIKSVFVERGMKSILDQFNEAMYKNKGKITPSPEVVTSAEINKQLQKTDKRTTSDGGTLITIKGKGVYKTNPGIRNINQTNTLVAPIGSAYSPGDPVPVYNERTGTTSYKKIEYE